MSVQETLPARVETNAVAMFESNCLPACVPVQAVKSQINAIQSLMRDVMHEGEHFGRIPGCGEKPSLLKAGAEKLCFSFRLAPEFQIQQTDLPGEHREYRVVCTLRSISTGAVLGAGIGLCSTQESRYRWRKAERRCPECGKETIIKGKSEFGGGWLCYIKKGGCGAKFRDMDPQIIQQSVGQVENPCLADSYNTVLKMSKKRALVDACLTCLGASDIFTQDIEDYSGALDAEVVHEETSPSQPAPPKEATAPAYPSQPPAYRPDPERAQLLDAILKMIKAKGRTKAKMAEITQYLWQVSSWADVTALPTDVLRAGLEMMSAPTQDWNETQNEVM